MNLSCITRTTAQSFLKPRNVRPTQSKPMWEWINIIFNKVDEDRRKTFGPDRTCAEWLLRNGAAVKWTTAREFLTDYNSLPIAGTVLYIKEVDASDSSIMHYGFAHFAGCKHIDKVILHKCSYLEDPSFALLKPLDGSLKSLQVSSCGNVTQVGLLGLESLGDLRELRLFDLPNVGELGSVVDELKGKLSKCNIITDPINSK